MALAGAGLLGLTACERPGSPTAAPAAGVDAPVDAALAAAAGLEEQALTALGFAPSELTVAKPAPGSSAEPGADPSAGPGRGERGKNRRPLARALLRGRVLHAEAVVQTDEGVKTLISQRGTITAIDDRSVTVKSADGFTLTWTFGDEVRVIDRRRTVQPTELAEGVEVGVAGAKDGDTSVARLIIRPFKQK
jgi:hypothetical protein